MTEDRPESVLSRWSRRKLEAREAKEDPTPVDDIEVTAESRLPETIEDAEPEVPASTDADMPDIDTLTDESDFSPFMSPGVSEELRKLALRKMFRSTVFNVRDGLDEYDDDFTSFEKLGDIVTADMKHRIEMEQQKLKEKLEAEDAVAEDEMEIIEDEDELEVAEATGEAPQSQSRATEPASLEQDPEEDIDEQY